MYNSFDFYGKKTQTPNLPEQYAWIVAGAKAKHSITKNSIISTYCEVVSKPYCMSGQPCSRLTDVWMSGQPCGLTDVWMVRVLFGSGHIESVRCSCLIAR